MEANEIFVSRGKPAINYVLAIQVQASQGIDTHYIRARGDNISKAVDIAQIAVNRFLTNYKVMNVNIGTDTFEADDKKRNVSTIEICIKKVVG